MATRKQEDIVHRDLLGVELAVGCYVASYKRGQYSSVMLVAKITRFTSKKVELESVKSPVRKWLMPPEETVRLVSEDVLAYILK